MNWRAEREHMQKLSANISGMEKTAQSKWRAAIDATQSQSELSNLFAHFNRNRYVNGWTNPVDKSGLNTTGNVEELHTPIKQFLSQYTQGSRHDYLSKPISELSPEELVKRRSVVGRRANERRTMPETSYKAMDIDSGHGPEDWMPIIHGTNRAKAEAFIASGNGASKMDSEMALENGTHTNMGIFVHSKFPDRAPHYAQTNATARGGDPVILEGQIQRKHLFPNPSRSSGFGDEYMIPPGHYDKIQNSVIRSAY